jgi:DeoR/GlpR family transcriptional regulator of sugar metabolism
MTVRRDLTALAERGLLQKVHGGAAPIREQSTNEPSFAMKARRELAEKEAIAERAASLVSPGEAVAISAGTTTYALARRLADVPRLTIVTNSLPVANLLHEHARPDQTVVVTGGVPTPSDALGGPVAVSTIHTLHVDTLFLGVHGMDVEAGFTSPNLYEAEANRALVASAHQLVVLADRTKFGVVGLSSIAPLRAADVLITDAGLGARPRDVLREHVRSLVLVPVAPVEAGDGVAAPAPAGASGPDGG